MSITRVFLNNGFFVLLFIIIAIIYIAYSDVIKQDHDLLEDKNPTQSTEQVTSIENTIKSIVKKKVENIVDKSVTYEASELAVKDTEKSVEVEKTADIFAKEEVKNEENNIADELAIKDIEEPVELEKPANEVVDNNKVEIDVKKTLSKYSSFVEAIGVARDAFYNKEFVKAEEIYYSLVAKKPTAMLLDEFGNVLFEVGKKDLADISWFEAGRKLIKNNRINAAVSYANRLRPISKVTAENILKEVDIAIKARESFMLEQQKDMETSYQKEIKIYRQKLKNYNEAMQNKKMTKE